MHPLVILGMNLFFSLLASQCMGFSVVMPPNRKLSPRRNVLTVVNAAGMGMGVAEKGKKSSAKKKGTNFDVSASLMRLEKQYEELEWQSNKAIARNTDDEEDSNDDPKPSSSVTLSFEYVVAARSTSGMSSHGAIADWVPIAQLICTCNSDGVSDETRQAAVSLYCRELAHAAYLGAPVFQNVARKDLQYSLESKDSFYKHVYDVVHRGVDPNSANGQTMTKAEARTVLRLQEDESDMKVIKQSYRRLSFDLHPDRLAQATNGDANVGDSENANGDDFHKIKMAYDTLTSGIRTTGSSWYQSLGGRARTDFSGPISLILIESAQQLLDKAGVKSAVCGIDSKLVQSFVTRNQAAV